MGKLIDLISRLKENRYLEPEEFVTLLNGLEENPEDASFLQHEARETALHHFGKDIYIRGLIEFTNFCRNDCFYCGIRKSNLNAVRYHLSKSTILECCRIGYDLGFRTFVLQGGEDMSYTDHAMTDIIASIRRAYPDCAITLSVGEREKATYQEWFDAGANRYLLRHETADPEHYRKLHPMRLRSEHRMQCLRDLKSIGYQTGTGFMVGSPFQTTEHLAKDLQFIHEFKPEMIGIGPFLPHSETPFKNCAPGSMQRTLHLISILRLMRPNALIPSTTALGTIHPEGRELGILAGANVVMPNLSPLDVRKNYLLYDNKICTGEEAAESIDKLKERICRIGYRIVTDRGDYKKGDV